VSSLECSIKKPQEKIMRTLQFAGVAIIFGILTAKTIRDIMKDMKEKSDYGYDRRGDDHLDDNV